MKGTSELVLV